MRKSSGLYLMILLVWTVLLVAAWSTFMQDIAGAYSISWYAGLAVVASVVFMGYFWLNGMKTLTYALFYYLRLKHVQAVPDVGIWARYHENQADPEVLLVYCTRNDFNPECLRASMQQDYAHTVTVILDDSNDQNHKMAVDEFAASFGVKVVRRKEHVGFKAGNLNNYLKHATYDYFVLLDSDEIIPKNFITRSLDYFTQGESVGIVQANHTASRARTWFDSMFARSIESQNGMIQSIKQRYGFASLQGHGAMISRECYVAVGGFPHVVSEDLCFSIEARQKGFSVLFAPDIMCQEAYPVDYLAFKQRQSKWVQGNVEFMKQYTPQILKARMRWYEKLDVILHTYNLPVHAFFSLFVPINAILLPAVHYHVKYPVWMIIPTVVFFIAPMLNDIIYFYHKLKLVHLMWYLAHTSLLYGSMFFISLRATVQAVFGSASFPVTPKNVRRLSLGSIFRANIYELTFAVLLLWVAEVVDGNPLLVLLIALPSIMSIYFSILAQRSESDIAIE